MDFESIKKLGIDRYNIDFKSVDEIYDHSTNNHIIKLHLKKEKTLICPHYGLVNSSRLRSNVKQDVNRIMYVKNNDVSILINRKMVTDFSSEHPFL